MSQVHQDVVRKNMSQVRQEFVHLIVAFLCGAMVFSE